jgi:hypothetical protein
MGFKAPLTAKIVFIGAWLGVLTVVWLFGALIGWLPEPPSPPPNLWLPMCVTLAALGVMSVILGLLTLSSGERKWAIGGIIGGALVIVTEGLFVWLVIGALQGLRL